jgi:hypothetical protein
MASSTIGVGVCRAEWAEFRDADVATAGKRRARIDAQAS